MNKADLARELSDRAMIPIGEAQRVINYAFGLIEGALIGGGEVVIQNFGAFHVSARRGYTGHNPKNGASMEVPPRRVAAFRAGQRLKDRLNVQ